MQSPSVNSFSPTPVKYLLANSLRLLKRTRLSMTFVTKYLLEAPPIKCSTEKQPTRRTLFPTLPCVIKFQSTLWWIIICHSTRHASIKTNPYNRSTHTTKLSRLQHNNPFAVEEVTKAPIISSFSYQRDENIIKCVLLKSRNFFFVNSTCSALSGS